MKRHLFSCMSPGLITNAVGQAAGRTLFIRDPAVRSIETTGASVSHITVWPACQSPVSGSLAQMLRIQLSRAKWSRL
jgi:hypothetical protein